MLLKIFLYHREARQMPIFIVIIKKLQTDTNCSTTLLFLRDVTFAFLWIMGARHKN